MKDGDVDIYRFIQTDGAEIGWGGTASREKEFGGKGDVEERGVWCAEEGKETLTWRELR